MKNLLVIIISFVSFIPGIKILAQADISMTTHHIYNRSNYNPAFIARPYFAYLYSNIRHQWIGVDGAPKVYNIQVSEYIHSLRSAIGLSLVNDKIGATRAFNPMLMYAYRITNNRNWALSMGLSGGVFSRTIDGSLFEAELINDPSVLYSVEKDLRPDANIGIELKSTSFIIGLTSTHLFSIGKEDYSFLNTNHRFGYFIYRNNNLESFYYELGLHVVNRYNLTVFEGNTFIRFKHATGLMKGPREIFDLGMSFRSSRQMTFLIGVLVTPDIRIGYAYDQSFISGYNQNGTHEIMLEYRILNKMASTRNTCGKEVRSD